MSSRTHTESRLKPLPGTFVDLDDEAAPRPDLRRSHSFADFIPYRLESLAMVDIRDPRCLGAIGKAHGIPGGALVARWEQQIAGLPDWSDSECSVGDTESDTCSSADMEEETIAQPRGWPGVISVTRAVDGLGGGRTAARATDEEPSGSCIASTRPESTSVACSGDAAAAQIADAHRQRQGESRALPVGLQVQNAVAAQAPPVATARSSSGAVLLRLEDHLGVSSERPGGESAAGLFASGAVAAGERRAPSVRAEDVAGRGGPRHAGPNGAPQHSEAAWGNCVQTKDVLREGTTTLMIRNLPARLTTQALVEELCRSGFAGKFDFCYVPCNFNTGEGRGFGFVNLMTPALAAGLHAKWRGLREFAGEALTTAMNISVAEVQGKAANVAALAGPNRRRIRNPVLRPFIAGA